MKKLYIFLTFIILISQVYSLNTYVGIKIENLTDESSLTCAGTSGYGNQGRIRALSSILPSHPIYMEILDSKNSVIAIGNVSDGDYGLGETIFFPTQLDLNVGEDYTIFFDIDAIKLYLPFRNKNDFIQTPDNNYWTDGHILTLGSNQYEFGFISSSSGCTPGCGKSGCGDPYFTNLGPGDGLGAVFSDRNNLNYSCFSDDINNNCDNMGIGVYHTYNRYFSTYNSYNFRIKTQYQNLFTPSVGNFKIGFTFQ